MLEVGSRRQSSTSHLEIACVLLIKGQHRSVDSYISTTKRMHILAGGKWTDQHILVARDSLRAAKRGQGPAKQEQPLPSEEIVSLTATVAPRPEWLSVAILVVVCAWLVREIESAADMVQHVKFHPPKSTEEGWGWAEWSLQPAAQGTVRSPGRECPSASCPMRAMRAVLEAACREDKGSQSPLFSTAGQALTKKQMVALYVGMITVCGLPLRHITRHSARVTGAMRMAWVGYTAFSCSGVGAVSRKLREELLGRKSRRLSLLQGSGGLPSDVLALEKVAFRQPVMSEGDDRCWIEKPPFPKYVQTMSRGVQGIHVLTSATMTACKWTWSSATPPVSVTETNVTGTAEECW